jgi:hypothetical protein
MPQPYPSPAPLSAQRCEPDAGAARPRRRQRIAVNLSRPRSRRQALAPSQPQDRTAARVGRSLRADRAARWAFDHLMARERLHHGLQLGDHVARNRRGGAEHPSERIRTAHGSAESARDTAARRIRTGTARQPPRPLFPCHALVGDSERRLGEGDVVDAIPGHKCTPGALRSRTTGRVSSQTGETA